MARLVRIRISALDELARQLRYTPPAAARRHLRRAERFAAEIERDRLYPEDDVVERITGYRPAIDQPAMLVGDALLADLSALIERLCAAARLTIEDLERETGEKWLTLDQLGEQWGVSRKTIQRYRRNGLIAMRIAGERGTARLYFRASAVRRFESAHAQTLRSAADFTRLSAQERARALRAALRLRNRFGWPMTAIAHRLAQRYGRSPETIRRALIEHDRSQRTPVFRANRSAADEPDSTHNGSSGGAAARGDERLPRKRASATARRAALNSRAKTLRALTLVPEKKQQQESRRTQPAAPASTDRTLDAEPVRTGLGIPAPPTLSALIEEARTAPALDAMREAALANACLALRKRAAATLASLPRHNPRAADIDKVETDLRWASRVKAKLVRAQLPLLIKTVEGRLERDLGAIPGQAATALLLRGIGAISRAIDRFEPPRTPPHTPTRTPSRSPTRTPSRTPSRTSGGRLSAPAGLAIDRAVAAWQRAEGAGLMAALSAGRALPRSDPAAVTIPDWTRLLDPWQATLEPPAPVRDRLLADHSDSDPVSIDPSARAAAMEHYCWWPSPGGPPPQTLDQIAARHNARRWHTARLIRKAVDHSLIKRK